MVISAMTSAGSNPVTVPTNSSASIDSSVVRQMEGRKSNGEIGNMIGTEEYVRQYFSDIPIMVSIANCESNFRQLDKSGEVHRGVKNSADVGVMQINEHYHLDESVRKNYDIYTISGNTAYARKLYEKQGTDPWSSSKTCWGKYENKTINLAVNTK